MNNVNELHEALARVVFADRKFPEVLADRLLRSPASCLVRAHKLLATLVDLTSAGAAADAEAMTDRDCHVASAVDGKAAGRAILGDQRTDKALITALDRTVAEVAHHSGWCWHRPRIVQDGSAPVVAEEDRH